MPLDYNMTSSLVRIKRAQADNPGAFVDDEDVADPAVALPEHMFAQDATDMTALAWRVPNRSGSKVKVKVTFRKDDGTEVAGTFDAYGFVVVPLHPEEAALSDDPDNPVRPAIEKQCAPGDELVGWSSGTFMVLDDLGVYDTFGLVLSNITAPDATMAFFRVEEVE